MSTDAPRAEAETPPRFRDALRSLPLRVWIVSFGILINRLGNFLPVFIVLYLTEQGYSAGAAGLVLGVSGLANVLGNAIGGHLADKIGRRWTIVLPAIPTAVLTAMVPFIESFPLIVVVVGLIGVTSQIFRPAAAAVLVDSVSTNQDRLAAFGVFRFAMNIGASLGGVIGGFLASTSYVGLFLGNAVASLVFGVAMAVLLRDKPGSSQTADETPSEESPPEQDGGYRQALRDRRLVRFLLMTVIGELVYIQCFVALPLHVSGVGLSSQDFGLLIGLNGLIVLACELPLIGALSRYRVEYVLAVGNLLVGVGLGLSGAAGTMGLLAVTVLVWTVGEMMSSAVANAYLASVSPPRLVGRYQGMYFVAYTIGAGAGPLLGGALFASNPTLLWILVGLGGVASGWLALPARPRSPPDGEPRSKGIPAAP